MPISLPPVSRVSRRRFLSGSLAAGLGLLMPRWLPAADEKLDLSHIALLSDTHIAGDKTVRKVNKDQSETNMWDNIVAACKAVLSPAGPDRAAAAIVTGDLAYLRGLDQDYKVFLEGIDPLRQAGLGVHVLMGNHDDRANFFKGVPTQLVSQQQEVVDRQIGILETPNANLFMLDSLDKTNVTPGKLGEQQLAWLAKALDARANKPAIILGHHDPDFGTKKMGIVETEAFLKLIGERKQVKAYVYGHTHNYAVVEKEGIFFVNLPPVAYVFGPTRPSGWMDLRIGKDGAVFELRSLDGKHPDHGKKHDLKWRV